MSVTSTSPSSTAPICDTSMTMRTLPCPIFEPMARPLASTSPALADAIARERVLALLLALHGLGTRLEDVDLAVLAVAAPFDVHGASVVLLDGHRVARELFDLRVGEREALALGGSDFHFLHRAARLRLAVEHELDRLAAQPPAQYRGLAVGKAELRDVELVGIHRALDDGLAQAVARGDEHHFAEARLGVHREHDARGAQVASHHALHAGGDRRPPRARSPCARGRRWRGRCRARRRRASRHRGRSRRRGC